MNRPAFQRYTRRENPSAAEGGGFEPPVREPVRQFSKLLVSATHPSFLQDLGVRNRGVISLNAGAKVRLFFQSCKFFRNFFRKKLFECNHLRKIFIQVKGVLQGVAAVYVSHSQVIKISLRYGGVGDALLESLCTTLSHDSYQ